MRKTAKILSVLLTLCLLCGVMLSVVASADTGSNAIDYHESLSVSGHEYNSSWDFQDGEYGTWGNLATGTDYRVLGDTNKYLHLSPDAASGVTGASNLFYPRKDVSGVWPTEAALTTLAYFTIDFDFATDNYLLYNETTGKFDTYSDTLPEGTADNKWIPAYGYNSNSTRKEADSYSHTTNRKFWFATRFNITNYYISKQYIGYETDTQRYYFFGTTGNGIAAANETTDRYYLPDEVGVFTHITKVYTVTGDATNGYTLTEYVYINGEYFSSSYATVASPTLTYIAFQGYKGDCATSNGYYYSYALDNIAFNHYASSYSTAPETEGAEDTVYGLDDYDFTAATPAPIYTLDDVLYNEKYITPNTETYIDIDGAKYYNINAAKAVLESELKTGGTISIAADITGFTPKADVKSFTVVCQNGAEFSLSEDAEYQVFSKTDGDVTTYTVVSNVLSITGDTYFNNNFEDGAAITVADGNFVAREGVTMFEVEKAKSSNGNNYVSITSSKNQTALKRNWVRFFNRSSKTAYPLNGYSYVTFDFDFGTDRYVYYDANNVPHTTVDVAGVATPITSVDLVPTNPETGEKYEYHPAYALYDVTRLGCTTSQYNYFNIVTAYTTDKNSLNFGIYKDSNGFYLKAHSGTDVTAVTEKAYLSGEVGIFDHITVVHKVDGYKTDIFLYVNGQLHATASEDYTSSSALYAPWMQQYITSPAPKTIGGTNYDMSDYYALAFDNVVVNKYSNGQVPTTALDTFFSGDDFNKIYNCSGFVYNDNYVTPNPERYITVNGDKTYVINAGLDAINAMTGSENSVTTSVDVDYAPAANLTGFNLTLADGAKFNTSKGAFSYVSAGDNAYTVSRIATEANVDLFGDMTFNLYVPVAEGALTKVTGADSSIFTEGKYKISWTPDIESFATQDVVLYYGDAVSSTITLDVVKYAEAVMSATKEDGTTLLYPCGSEAAVLVYEMMQYKVAVAAYAGESVSDSYREFIKLYDSHENCTCNSTATAPYADQNQTCLSGVGIAYQVDTDMIGIVITGVADDTAVSVSYSYMYESEPKTESFAAEDKGDYYLVNIPAAFLYKTLTFNIGGTEFDYSLSQYIYNIRSGDDGLDAKIEALNATIANLEAQIEAAGDADTPELDAQLATAQSQLKAAKNTVSLVNAMYQYSVAAFEYKYDYTNITPAE